MDVILLADSDLMEFPLESLELLDNGRIHSVSRDFSLQMLYERMKNYVVENTNGKKKAWTEKLGLSGIRTRDLSHPKRESYP